MARSEHPDVIVLDLMMQDVSGYDVLEVLREDEDTKDLPIVILTAVTMQRERDRCLAKGADVVLIKPFDPQEVAQAVVALLPPAASTA
jgi:two-component system, OmpR family, alkaline phosphatase synthesis response regulator PhoP